MRDLICWLIKKRVSILQLNFEIENLPGIFNFLMKSCRVLTMQFTKLVSSVGSTFCPFIQMFT